jgi:hypothetical protein
MVFSQLFVNVLLPNYYELGRKVRFYCSYAIFRKQMSDFLRNASKKNRRLYNGFGRNIWAS